MIDPEFTRRHEQDQDLSLLWWQPMQPLRAVSTALVGGGIGPMEWFLNAQVLADYDRFDPAAHVRELAEASALHGPGVGMLTAVDVVTVEQEEDDGVAVLATVGLGWPTWAAAPPPPATGPEPATGTAPPVGTINILIVVPDQLGDGALVNLLATATEAKVQALVDAGVAGTGTASDAICVACDAPAPAGRADTDTEADADGRRSFGGPRSYWGSRAARAVYRAVRQGAAADWERATANGWPRPPRQGG